MEILKINSKNYRKIINQTIKSIKEGKVIVCPTDTVYGLICDASNKKAVKHLFKIKKRPRGKPIPIFVKDLKMAKKFAQINKNQEKFLRKVWPGKVTTVLKGLRPTLRPPAKAGPYQLPKILFGERKTIGLRIPNYKLVNTLLGKINLPLTGTSANISGQPPSGSIKEVLEQFKKQKYQPDLIIDIGNLPKSKPSTVLDLTISPPKVLRP